MYTSTKLYEIITQKVIISLEKGVIPWVKPWKGASLPMNFKTGYKYKGINLLLLALSGFNVPYFLTFNQVRELGGKVKRGAEASLVIFWSWKEKSKTVDGKEETETYPVLQYYHVFNITQTDGIEYESRFDQMENFNPLAICDEVVLGYEDSPAIEHNEQRAYYHTEKDLINMPSKKSFRSEEDYYKTLFHEMIHSTGNRSRLNRDIPAVLNDRSEYSKEEVIAELGATFLCGHTHIEANLIDDSASYIEFWLKQLKQDKKFVFSVSSQAQKAVEYILGQTNCAVA